MKISVIIPAGGVGSRFGGEIPKQYAKLGESSVIAHTIAAFDAVQAVDRIVVAADEKYFEEIRGCQGTKPLVLVRGEATRAQSVQAALSALPEETQIVLVHDAVRPFVSRETIEAVAAAAQKHGAAVACAPVTDTIKEARDGLVIATLDRSQLWQAQTPQGFTYENIRRAYAADAAILAEATDDSSLAERAEIPVHIVPSPPQNIKITTQNDLRVADIRVAGMIPPPQAGESSPISTPAIKKVKIHTDGACSGNPGPGGWAAVLVHKGRRKEISGGEVETTNNRMEMTAVIRGLEMLKGPCEVEVFSDSRYVVDAIEKGWAARWRQNGWMRNKKEPALNADLWEEMLKLLAKHKVTVRWVKGHAGDKENERCDELARTQCATK